MSFSPEPGSGVPGDAAAGGAVSICDRAPRSVTTGGFRSAAR